MTPPFGYATDRMARIESMRFRSLLLARLVAMVYLALAAWVAYTIIQMWASVDWRSATDSGFGVVFSGVFAGLTAYLAWLAARLWRDFSAATVRWASATTVAMGAFAVLSAVHHWLAPELARSINSVLGVALVAIGAVVYRRMSRRIIARAGLDDPTDPLGHPAGHAERVKAFCTILGWAVFLAASEVTVQAVLAHPHGWWSVLGVLPIVIGWLTYRIVLWRMTPPTRPALPPGGFQVLPPSPPKDVA